LTGGTRRAIRAGKGQTDKKKLKPTIKWEGKKEDAPKIGGGGFFQNHFDKVEGENSRN